MADVLERIKNERVKKWYKNNINPTFLNTIVSQAEQDGYVLDPESGLLTRKGYSDKTIKQLGRTIIDIISLGPTNLHYHEDVDEVFYIINGKGAAFYAVGFPDAKVSKFTTKEKTEPQSFTFIRDISSVFDNKAEGFLGIKIDISKGIHYSFKPGKDSPLKIRLNCSGILDPKKEVCVEKFDEFTPWVEYYESQKTK